MSTQAVPTTLAIDGGVPVVRRSFGPWPYYAPDEVAAVQRVLESGKVNYWTGEECREFEREYAAYTGSRFAIAMANGSLAIEAALIGLGIGAGDEVIVTPRTFIASATSAVLVGAQPVFADVDRETQAISAETIQAVLTPKTKAIIVVHLGGCPADMDPILELAQKHNLKVIEDCAQANGARYKGRPVGSMGHVGTFSFCQDKIITTAGEGGLVVTDDEAVWSRMWSLKDHGKSFEAVYKRQHGPGFRWLHESVGSNWRMTEVQGAVGRLQLRKLDSWIAVRRRNANVLEECFSEFSPSIRIPKLSSRYEHAYYKYYVFVRPEGLQEGWSRDRILSALQAEGVPAFSGSCSEVYLEKAFDKIGRPEHRLPIAKELGDTSLMFLVHPTLTEEDMQDYCTAVRKVMAVASK